MLPETMLNTGQKVSSAGITNRTMDHDHNHIETREGLIGYDLVWQIM